MILKRFQLGLIHAAMAITLVPINSTLNRVMIKELAISAALVAILASLPYLFSPIQMAIGSFSDRHPILGWRRTPYIFLGLLLCVAGVILSPQVAYFMVNHFFLGLLLAILAFGAWGMGFNFATVSYLSLASELSGEKGRSRTISVMWFMMITGIILTAMMISRMLEGYTPELLNRAFWMVGGVALFLGLLGLAGLEKRSSARADNTPVRHSWKVYLRIVAANSQVRLFFIYLVLLLAAILGQDVLLEPFGGQAFDLPVNATTRITSIWGICVLAALLVAGMLESRLNKKTVASIGAWVGIIAFSTITVSGFLVQKSLFYTGVVLLGVGTGLSTVSNLSLMLDMTTARSVGLFMGAWGMANAFARGLGAVMSGVVRDTVSRFAHDLVMGYAVVFILFAVMLLISLGLLRQVDVQAFQERSQEEDEMFNLIERAALANDAG